MSGWVMATLLLYAPITALVFMWWVVGVYEARDHVPVDDDEVRHRARLAFTAPFWPFTLVFVMLRGLVRLARLAFGGAR